MSDYLEHHGVLGMKWGVRRYQPYSLIPRKSGKSGKLVGEAKKAKRLGKGKASSSKKKRGAKSNNNKDAYRPKKAPQKKLSQEEKEAIIRSGDMKQIAKYSNQMNNNEIRQAIERVSLNERISEANKDSVKSGMDRAEAIFNNVNRAKGMAEKGIGAYNTIAKVYNSLSDEPIPVLDGTYKKRSSAEVKRLIKDGSAQEIWANRDKFTQEDRDKINKRFSFEKATQAQMQKERDWRSAENEKFIKRHGGGLGDSPFDRAAADRAWDMTGESSRAERQEYERTTQVARDWVASQQQKPQPVLQLDYDRNAYAENKRLQAALHDSAERYDRMMREERKKKKR